MKINPFFNTCGFCIFSTFIPALCKRAAADFAEIDAKYGSSVEIIKVDVTKNQDMVNKFKVTKLPTIVVGDKRINGYSSGLAAKIENNIKSAAPGINANNNSSTAGSSTIGALSQTISENSITADQPAAASANETAQSSSTEAGCVTAPVSSSSQTDCINTAQITETVKKYCNKGIINKIKNFFRSFTKEGKSGGFFSKIKNFFKKAVDTVKSIFTGGCSTNSGANASNCNNSTPGCGVNNTGAVQNAASAAPKPEGFQAPASTTAEELGRGGMSGK